MARPDEKILFTIEGYTIKKGNNKGEVFLMSPKGVCFTIPATTLEKINEELKTNEVLKEQLKLS